MSSAYVIRNQLGQYLTRKGEWISGKDSAALFHQPWYDQALNHLIEINSKDIGLRGKVVELELDEKGRPVVLELGPDAQQGELLAGTGEPAESAVASSVEEAPAVVGSGAVDAAEYAA